MLGQFHLKDMMGFISQIHPGLFRAKAYIFPALVSILVNGTFKYINYNPFSKNDMLVSSMNHAVKSCKRFVTKHIAYAGCSYFFVKMMSPSSESKCFSERPKAKNNTLPF